MNLIFLTKFYPFGTGESFIENEIFFLSTKFERILIISCDCTKNIGSKRKLPSNVECVKIKEKNKICDILSGVFSFKRPPALKKEIKSNASFRTKIFMLYFEAKCRRIFKSVCKTIDLSEYRSSVLYSYWLFSTARVAQLLDEKIGACFKFCRTHRYDLYEEKNDLRFLPYRYEFLDFFDYILPCSENGTTYLKQKYPSFEKKIKTSFLGTKDYGLGPLSDDYFHIVSCSRIAPEKKVERIVKALELIDKLNVSNIVWTHFGDGDGLKAIKSLSSKFTNIKTEFKGNRPNSEVMKFYSTNHVDIFLNVSSSEGLPVSIMEAMSFGIPTIATDVGGTSEIVTDGVTGFLLKNDYDDNDLVEDIRFFIEAKKDGRIINYRQNCRKKWLGSFNAEDNYKKFCDFIVQNASTKNEF